MPVRETFDLGVDVVFNAITCTTALSKMADADPLVVVAVDDITNHSV